MLPMHGLGPAQIGSVGIDRAEPLDRIEVSAGAVAPVQCPVGRMLVQLRAAQAAACAGKGGWLDIVPQFVVLFFWVASVPTRRDRACRVCLGKLAQCEKIMLFARLPDF